MVNFLEKLDEAFVKLQQMPADQIIKKSGEVQAWWCPRESHLRASLENLSHDPRVLIDKRTKEMETRGKKDYYVQQDDLTQYLIELHNEMLNKIRELSQKSMELLKLHRERT